MSWGSLFIFHISPVKLKVDPPLFLLSEKKCRRFSLSLCVSFCFLCVKFVYRRCGNFLIRQRPYIVVATRSSQVLFGAGVSQLGYSMNLTLLPLNTHENTKHCLKEDRAAEQSHIETQMERVSWQRFLSNVIKRSNKIQWQTILLGAVEVISWRGEQ